jgi:hypothetical protein
MSHQTRQILHEFLCFLAKLNRYRGDSLDFLRKVTESNVFCTPVTQLPIQGNDNGCYPVIEAADDDGGEAESRQCSITQNLTSLHTCQS